MNKKEYNLKNKIMSSILAIFLSDRQIEERGYYSIRDIRINTALKYCEGKVLDIGCGYKNILISKYKNGIGLDIYPWPNVDILYKGLDLPFKDESFDTITFLASFDHIIEREKILKESYRILKKDGKIIVSIVNPFLNWINHEILGFRDEDTKERWKKKEGEVFGFSLNNINKLFKKNNFLYIKNIPFFWNLGKLVIYRKYS